MKNKIILNGSDWYLAGWNRHQWKYERSMETSSFSVPFMGGIPATVPGSVQTDLLKAGLIEDWNYGTNFRKIEWIERREWVYTKSFEVTGEAKHYILHLDGLDFSGFVFLNGKQILEFKDMHLRKNVEITNFIDKENPNEIKVVFLQLPEVDGQVGYTSKVSILKSRFNYGWDWCPRLVNVGIFGDVWVECCDNARITDFYPDTDFIAGKGSLKAEIKTESFVSDEFRVKLELFDGEEKIAKTEKAVTVNIGANTVLAEFEDLDVKQWYPNGFGEQPLYTLKLTVLDSNGKVCDEIEKTVGFRNLEYVVPENAPAGYLRYSPKINGKIIPLRGVNWVPISPFYGTVKEKDYKYYLTRFAEMGCNLMRVWGGALQESETFYKMCDELGLMVWQEFPQSSSGIENEPNEDEKYIEDLKIVAKEFILRARSHVSLAFWCGGNELYYGEELYPADESSNNLAMLSSMVKEFNSKILYLPASPSHCIMDKKHVPGEKDWVNGDCHGSWLYEGVVNHYKMIDENPSVLFSELGTPACARPQKLEQYSQTELWPPNLSNNYWITCGTFWVIYDEITELFGNFEEFENKIAAYASAFRFIQAESLRSSAASVRIKGKEKAGMIIWMANEPFPNAANTSLLEFDGCPKPAYYEVKKCFSSKYVGLKYASPAVKGKTTAKVFACADSPALIGKIKLTVYNINGDIINQYNWKDISVDGYFEIDNVEIDVNEKIVLARITEENHPELTTEYIFTNTENAPFSPLLQAPKAELVTASLSSREISIENKSSEIVFFNEVVAEASDGTVAAVYPNNFSLLPGERTVCKTDRDYCNYYVVQMNQK